MSAPVRPSRVFRAADIYTGRIVLDGFPFRYVAIVPSKLLPAPDYTVMRQHDEMNGWFDEVLTAVEFLEARGWELAGLTQGFVACMRRI